jgi:hypothetical protein
MSAAHQLLTVQKGLTDLLMLLQHRSRTAQAAFAEVLQRWSDARGRRFAAEHLDPQARLLAATSEVLLNLSQSVEAAARHAQGAEAQLAQARLAADEVQQAGTEAERLTARVRQLTLIARDRTHSAESRCRSIGVALNDLMPPPA